MSFTYLEALAELNDPANAVKYSTWDAILNLAKSTSGDVLDTSGSSSVAERLLYNGKLPNGSWGSDVARELTNNGSGKYVSIFESEVGKLLSS